MTTRREIEAEIEAEITADSARFYWDMAAYLIDPATVPKPAPPTVVADLIRTALEGEPADLAEGQAP